MRAEQVAATRRWRLPEVLPRWTLVRRTGVRPRHNACMELAVRHQESESKGAFFVEGADGRHLAEMTYSRTNELMIIIDHTEVDPSLAGQGVGRKLLDALVGWARSAKMKVIPLCPFAKAQFGKDPAIRDVLM